MGSPSRRLCLMAALAAMAATSPQAGTAQYHTYSQMLSDLEGLEASHPTRARVISIGHGWELVDEFARRHIWALKISDNVTVEEGEPEVFFVGAHHAREWISVEVPLAIGRHLLENYATDPSIREIVDNKVVWIIPMVNPDGHAYTVSTNRCWRKNRRDNEDGTFGVDPNRNYGYEWGGSGSSGITSETTYRGPAPFSEPETQAMRDFLRSRPNMRAAISYHSYTQAFLRPWSHTLNFTSTDPPPAGELMLKGISDELRSRITAVHGEPYKDCLFQADRLASGRCASPHYASDGEFTDWVYHELNIPAFTIELRPRTASLHPAPSGCFGFELPASEIAPTVQENLPAALALIRYIQPGQVLIRDHGGDTGAVPSSTLTSAGWIPPFWGSPDIRSAPSVPIRGQTATVTATVHNLTSAPVTNVTVQIFYTDPRITLEFPSPDAILLGEGTVNLPPNGTAEFSAPWAVPTSPNSWGEYHWCVGVVVKHPDDLPASTHPVYSSNVAIRNFQPARITVGSGALRFEAVNPFSIAADLELFVGAERLPDGWTVRLDPERPEILAPGERYLGFAEVVTADDAEEGDALISVQGALTPRRPGAVNPVGGGIDYEVSYQPSRAAGRPGLWFSFHLGYGFPVGSLDDEFDPGPSVTVDLEHEIAGRLSLLGVLGYHSFHGDGTADLSYTNLSVDLRAYVPSPIWRWFVQGGGGAYFGDPAPDDFGLNVGTGLDLAVRGKLSLEVGLAAHWVDPGGADRFFLDPTLGVAVTF